MKQPVTYYKFGRFTKVKDLTLQKEMAGIGTTRQF